MIMETRVNPQYFEPPSVLPCFANGAQALWPTCCVHVALCRPAWQQPKKILQSS